MYTFYCHGGSGNHGCEAIVRASAAILEQPICLYSVNPEQDRAYGLEQVVRILEDRDSTEKKYGFCWLKARMETKLLGSIVQGVSNRKKEMFDSAKKGDVWFSIGGDNYCYPGTDLLAAENYILHKRGVKTVLWGCSIEPDLLQNSNIVKDLARYTLIVARESISYEALKSVNANTILCPDPAFTLRKVELPLPPNWKDGDMIGLNISPLALRCGKNGEVVLDAYRKLIKTILRESESGIALIPHVVWHHDDDREPLTRLYQEFEKTGRIVLISDCNCMELKGIISRCQFFVGTRTHATIAAYSSGVPTLVVGYSVKARGIARDLFGTDEGYVLPVQELTCPEQLVDAFTDLYKNRFQIAVHLKTIFPGYLEKCAAVKDAVEKLM